MATFDLDDKDEKIYSLVEPWVIDGWVEQYLETKQGFRKSSVIAAHINIDPYVNVSTRAVSISGKRLVRKGIVECALTNNGLCFRHLNPLPVSSPVITEEEIMAIEKKEKLFAEIIYGSLLAAKGNKLMAAALLAQVNRQGYNFNRTEFGKLIADKYDWLIKSRNGAGVTYRIER